MLMATRFLKNRCIQSLIMLVNIKMKWNHKISKDFITDFIRAMDIFCSLSLFLYCDVWWGCFQNYVSPLVVVKMVNHSRFYEAIGLLRWELITAKRRNTSAMVAQILVACANRCVWAVRILTRRRRSNLLFFRIWIDDIYGGSLQKSSLFLLLEVQ